MSQFSLAFLFNFHSFSFPSVYLSKFLKQSQKNKLKLYHLWIVQKYKVVLKVSFRLSVQKHNLVSSFSLYPPKIPHIQNVSQSFLTMKTQPLKAADPGNPLAGTTADVIFQMRPQNSPCSTRMITMHLRHFVNSQNKQQESTTGKRGPANTSSPTQKRRRCVNTKVAILPPTSS